MNLNCSEITVERRIVNAFLVFLSMDSCFSQKYTGTPMGLYVEFWDKKRERL